MFSSRRANYLLEIEVSIWLRGANISPEKPIISVSFSWRHDVAASTPNFSPLLFFTASAPSQSMTYLKIHLFAFQSKPRQEGRANKSMEKGKSSTFFICTARQLWQEKTPKDSSRYREETCGEKGGRRASQHSVFPSLTEYLLKKFETKSC